MKLRLRSAKSRRRSKQYRKRLGFEMLEDRRLLAIDCVPTPLDPCDSALTALTADATAAATSADPGPMSPDPGGSTLSPSEAAALNALTNALDLIGNQLQSDITSAVDSFNTTVTSITDMLNAAIDGSGVRLSNIARERERHACKVLTTRRRRLTAMPWTAANSDYDASVSDAGAIYDSAMTTANDAYADALDDAANTSTIRD
ncbi:MAG: hypothetical protein H6823_08920 [Planctomycetaceae bacterium]|nr:hypothetical protein [Planctomycetaceae bacterium]